jgi:hypothetical protein
MTLDASEVSACQSRISALEAELAAAAAEHSSRLSQQQKAFLGKLEQLRLVHNQQVTAAVNEAQVWHGVAVPCMPCVQLGYAFLTTNHINCCQLHSCLPASVACTHRKLVSILGGNHRGVSQLMQSM